MAKMKIDVTQKWFVNTFIREDKAGAKFCFILGSGASVESGINAGKTFMKQWRDELLAEGEDGIRDQAKALGLKKASTPISLLMIMI